MTQGYESILNTTGSCNIAIGYNMLEPTTKYIILTKPENKNMCVVYDYTNKLLLNYFKKPKDSFISGWKSVDGKDVYSCRLERAYVKYNIYIQRWLELYRVFNQCNEYIDIFRTISQYYIEF